MKKQSRTMTLSANRLLVLTHSPDGDAYGLDDGRSIAPKAAAEIQADLFVKPQNDGLFPGFSQTWKREG